MAKYFFLLIVLVSACKNADYLPKPHGYPKVYYPEKKYILFDTNAPYSFEYPTYAKMENKYKEEEGWQPFWYNINYMPFNATLHLSYKSFNTRAQFDSLFDDTRKLAYKHTIKADEIEETDVYKPAQDMSGIIFDLKGNTATNLNFYLSDGKKHFLRGALYFNAKTTPDSIAPIFQFLRQDVIHLIKTAKWNNK